MRTFRDRAGLGAVLLLMAVAIVGLAVLQYRWNRDASEATGVRLADALQLSMVNWHLDLFRNLSEVCLTIRMAAAFSQDLRDRVLAAYDRGMQTQEIAETFAVCPAWARRVKQRRRETGEITPRRPGGARLVKIDRARLSELVWEQPDATLAELRERLGVACALSAVCMALKALGLSFKKRRCTRRSRVRRM